MNSKPVISIVVPTRNRGALLEICLNGIQAQSYPHYEVLVMDDGSSLENRQILKRLMPYYGSRVQWHEINAPDSHGSGASVIRNKGIALAKGEFIAFCDDDDYWCREDHLETAVSAMRQYNAQAYFTGMRILDPEGNTLVENMMPNVRCSLTPGQKLSDAGVYRVSHKQILFYPDYAHLNITIASKALLDKIGGFWEQTCYAEDIDLFVRICDAADTILFRPDICAVHNAPAKRLGLSVSNGLAQQDKRLLEANVYQHLLMVCSHPLALKYARISLSYLYKVIGVGLKAEGKKKRALFYARCALAAYPTLKWSAYLAWMYLLFWVK
ncbi:MAG: hypothetical protein CTY16_13375 [Methylobacter sp.]|nr:MAG: hypothetical protein CTY16_13375 [Methylobacter sp.]